MRSGQQYLQSSLLGVAPSGVEQGWERAQVRVLVRQLVLPPSHHRPWPCSGSCRQAQLHWNSPLPHPFFEHALWVMQWCLAGMVAWGAEHGLALDWGKVRQVCAMWRERMVGSWI